MKNILRLLALVLALTTLMSFTSLTALAETAAPEKGDPPGENALHTELISYYSKLDLAPYQGKAIFLNFFTEWCSFCMEEMPSIKKVYETYSPDDIQVILVHVWDGEDASNTQSIRARFGLEDMTFFEDEDRTLSYLLSLGGYPLSVFIGKDGNIAQGVNAALSYEEMAGILDGMEIPKKPEEV